MSQQWISVKDAMTLAHRSKSVVYRWIADGRVRSRRGANGRKEVHGLDVLKAESASTPGRPSGVPATR